MNTSKTDKQPEVLHRQAGDLLEESRFELGNHILQRPLSVVGQIHENRDARGELNELLLNLFPQALVFLLLFRQFLLLLLGQLLVVGLLLGLLHGFGLVDDGLDFLI